MSTIYEAIRKLNEIDSETSAKRLFRNPSYRKNIKTFGIITANNPDTKRLTRKENRELNQEKIEKEIDFTHNPTETLLSLGHYPFYKLKGSYGNVEESYLIYNIELETLKKIAENAKQQSFIFGKNIDGKLVFEFWANAKNPPQYKYVKTDEKDFYVDATNAPDLYTQISRDFKINIPFEKMEASGEDLLEKINERCSLEKKYAENLDFNLEESLKAENNGRFKDLCRLRLYSDNFKKYY